ncbi:MAG TPA: MaoC family dehydratase [Rhizomicrobium sp.]|jgi:acyl dehydratase|nr:MaoC family dehydratase [Rhizomicrobium sp.]
MSAQYFEDIAIGAKRTSGSYTFTGEDIIRFAQKYDPQPFHIDLVAAKNGPFGELVASGWHTVSVWMKLTIESRALDGNAGGTVRAGVSPGFEDLQWSKPVRSGTTLFYSSEVIEKVELKSRPEWGIVKSRNEARDADGELYMRFIGKGFVARRPPVE